MKVGYSGSSCIEQTTWGSPATNRLVKSLSLNLEQHWLPQMARSLPLLFSSSGMLQSKVQKRTAYSQRQKSILQVWFEYNPHPNKATREQLAEDIGVPEHKIQRWFRDQRKKQRQLRSGCSSGKDETQAQSQPQPWTQEYLPKEARPNQTSIMRCQTSTLLQAFQENQFPGLAATEKLAKQTEVPKSRIQMSFQNQEAQHLGHSKREPVNSSEDGPDRWPHLTAQPEQMDLSTLPGMSPFPPSDFFGRNQTFLPTLPESHVSFVGCDSDGFCVSQASTVLTVQPAQAVQGVENSDSLVTGTEHLPVQLTLGEALSNTQPLFWPQSQEKCQDPKPHIGTEALQLKDFSQIDPEHEKQELQPLGQHDISYIMQWWEEWCQAVIAEWEPSREMLRHPGYTETHLEQQQAQSAEELSHPTDQLHQQ
ncbi:double homeobox protein B [Elephas maximus indicus]|uniref:double homeobox protein B n=1 Tax=Elephas maximus indicus TaxID=99487 RepID=UPI002117121E|nr:double homeobox protein B [Elephas maximus indicus]